MRHALAPVGCDHHQVTVLAGLDQLVDGVADADLALDAIFWCLEAARPLLSSDGTDYFGRLTAVWLRCAYGHIEPELQQLDALCRAWSRFFDPDAATDASEGATHGQ